MIDDRDYIGYGANPPDPHWPGGARIAVNINLNFEGGCERSIMDGDGVSEGTLNDIGARRYLRCAARWSNQRLSMGHGSAAGGSCACSANLGSRSACWRWRKLLSAIPN